MPSSRPRGGLGRGLGSLIPQADTAPEAETRIASSSVPVESISANPYQPRSSMDEDQLRSLAESIRENGLIQPLIVQQDGERYRLIAGHRRLEAAKLAAMESVPVVVRAETPNDNILLLALVENLQRADLSPLDEAAAYRELNRRFGMSTEEIAQRTGKSRSTVANSLRLLELSPRVKEMLESGQLSEGHARALLAIKDETTQVRAAQMVVDRGLNVRQTEAMVKQMIGQQAGAQSRMQNPEIAELERRFREALGTKVSLAGTPRKGKLTIHFYSEEELDNLYDVIARPSARRGGF